MLERVHIKRTFRCSFGLVAIFLLPESHDLSLGQQREAGSTTAPSAGPGHLSLHLFVEEPTDETKLAVKALGLPASWEDSGTKGRTVAIIMAGLDVEPEPLAHVDIPASSEGYRVASSASGQLQILAKPQHGLANVTCPH